MSGYNTDSDYVSYIYEEQMKQVGDSTDNQHIPLSYCPFSSREVNQTPSLLE